VVMLTEYPICQAISNPTFKMKVAMASYTQLYIHLVWATWDRLPLISPDVEPQLYAILAAKCKELGCTPLAIGGIADHVHMLVRFSPTLTIARLAGEIKGASSHAMTQSILHGAFFKWQGAYGAFTISKRSMPQVRGYILNQRVHHAQGTLLAELEHCVEADGATTDMP
jgi:putative transposase